MELWICREGETTANIKKIYEGHSDGVLTEKGVQQSKLLSLRLSTVDFTQIVCADVNRSRQTAFEIIENQTNKEIEYDSRLRDKNGGFFEGKLIEDMRKTIIFKKLSFRKFRANGGGENWIDVFLRAQSFLDELIVKFIKKDYVNDDRKSVFEKSILSKNNSIINNQSSIILIDNKSKFDENFVLLQKSKTTVPVDNEQMDKMIQNFDFKTKFSKPYKGYIEELTYPKILAIASSGFIMELMNVIRLRKNQKMRFINDAKNCSLFLIRIYCENCGAICYGKQPEKCKVQFDFVLYNDTHHLDCFFQEMKDPYEMTVPIHKSLSYHNKIPNKISK